MFRKPRTRATGTDGGVDLAPSPRERFFLLLLLALCLLLLGLGLWLSPDPSGVGTHRQLGLSACAYLARTGRPCPTCGATTAFSLAARGRLAAALAVQPLGVLVWALAVLLAGLCLHALLARRTLLLRLWAFPWATGLFVLAALVLLCWLYRLHAWGGD